MTGKDFNGKRVRELLDENSKTQLAIMVVNCEEELKRLKENMVCVAKTETRQHYDCRTWDDCVNPYADCLNCPLKKGGGGSARQFATNTTTSRPQV